MKIMEIEGNRELSGTIRISGAKNVMVRVMCQFTRAGFRAGMKDENTEKIFDSIRELKKARQQGIVTNEEYKEILAKMKKDKADKAEIERQLKEFLELMSGAGRFARLEERLIDAGSSVSGCGPAFADLFMEALADGGVACGLPRAKALAYAAQMVEGTAKLMLEQHAHPGVLKDGVCSPGGTTIQGVRALEANGFRSAAMEAVIAAYDKTVAMGN